MAGGPGVADGRDTVSITASLRNQVGYNFQPTAWLSWTALSSPHRVIHAEAKNRCWAVWPVCTLGRKRNGVLRRCAWPTVLRVSPRVLRSLPPCVQNARLVSKASPLWPLVLGWSARWLDSGRVSCPYTPASAFHHKRTSSFLCMGLNCLYAFN